MDAKKVTEMAEKYTAAWCSGNPAQIAGHFDEYGAISVNNGDNLLGYDALVEMAQGFYDEFPDIKIHMDALRSAGNNAVYFWTLEGTHSKTGNKVKVQGWEEWALSRDFKIVQSMGHFDEAEYTRQIEEGV